MGKPKFAYNIDRRSFDLCFSEETQTEICQLVDLAGQVPDKVTAQYLSKALSGTAGVISGWGAAALTEEVLQQATELKVILHSAGTVKGLVTEAVWQRGIQVSSNAHTNGIPVAEFNLGMILMCLKNVFGWQDRFARQGRSAWRRDDTVPGYHRSVVGIVGMGLISRHLLKLLEPFRFEILIASRWFGQSEADRYGATVAPLAEVMARSDVVTILAASTTANRAMISGDMLAGMRDGAALINTGRGALIDQEALLAELTSGRIVAALDVFDPEPPEEGSPFYSLPNVIITPHIAGCVGRECHMLGQQTLVELKHFLAGEPLEAEVTPEMFQRIA